MELVLYLSLVEVAFGMALIHCFIPRAALGPGFGKTISTLVFFSLLAPVILMRRFLPPGELLPTALLQGSGILSLGLWFTYFVVLNYQEDQLQRLLIVGATAAQGFGLVMTSLLLARHFHHPGVAANFGPSASMLLVSLLAGTFSSAFLMGSVTMAMLIGHWYLIDPGLEIDWLKGACLAFGGAIGLKGLAIVVSLMLGVASDPFGAQGFFDRLRSFNLDIYLMARFMVGLVVPAGFCIMAYKSAAIRSTQSSTGILFPAIVVVFMGEIIGLFLTVKGLEGIYI